MKSRLLFSSTAFVVFFAFGFWFMTSSEIFHNQISASSANTAQTATHRLITREPSAIQPLYDFSNLQGNALESASKQRLLGGFSVVKEDSLVGIQLGHFVVRNAAGVKQFACDHYTRIVLSFDGEGMAIGGFKPKMDVEGPCEISADINKIAPIWIPAGRILEEPVGDGEYDFSERQNIRISFKNVSDEWPTLWKLKSVRLMIPGGNSSDMQVNETDLSRMSDQPVLVSFR